MICFAETWSHDDAYSRYYGANMKLKRGAFSATFFLACLAALELEGVVLEEI